MISTHAGGSHLRRFDISFCNVRNKQEIDIIVESQESRREADSGGEEKKDDTQSTQQTKTNDNNINKLKKYIWYKQTKDICRQHILIYLYTYSNINIVNTFSQP